MPARTLILGCGYTGARVARILAARGHSVLATSRDPGKLPLESDGLIELVRMDVLEPETVSALSAKIPDRVRVLHSIPIIRTADGPIDPTPRLIAMLGSRPARLVYLSTTGVYGASSVVDENSRVAPCSQTDRLRVDAERAVCSGPWSGLVLRPAAIYGPGRGVHESIREGRFRLVEDGGNFVSRVHVEDLAALAEAALLDELTGAWPVADEESCTSRQMAEFCAELLEAPVPPSIPRHEAHHTRRANRRVDGSAIFRKLGVRLRYPSYRTGVPASLEARRIV